MTLAILFESVGAGEWLVLLAVLLIVVGPKRLPATARKFGQYYSKFRRAAESFKRQLLDMDSEFTNAVRDIESEVDAATKDVAADLTPPDPSEYGGFDEGYGGEYGGEPSADEATVATPPEPTPPEPTPPEPTPPEPKNGIKITVSPAPDLTKKAVA